QKDYSDEEDLAGEIKNDLLVMKRELQFVRSDLKDILTHQEEMVKRLQQEQAGKQEAEAGDTPAAQD
ncbi:MAG: hypothetical protein WBC77_08770, partial [Candidatus Zixiibacteriota bacterium]